MRSPIVQVSWPWSKSHVVLFCRDDISVDSGGTSISDQLLAVTMRKSVSKLRAKTGYKIAILNAKTSEKSEL